MNLTIAGIIAETVMPLALASGLPVSLCSIQQPTGGLTAGGEQAVGPGTYVPVSGLQNIICMDAPPSDSRTLANEQKSESEILSLQFRRVWLGGYFPQILGNDDNWQAIITGPTGTSTTYDLVGAEADSQVQQTRLSLRIATI